jgi:hypothetical protein
MAAVTLAKRTPYVVITTDSGDVLAVEPRLANPLDREAQFIDAFVHCLNLREVDATSPADAEAQVRAALDAEARGMTSIPLDRI